jgi:hypothetical protein
MYAVYLYSLTVQIDVNCLVKLHGLTQVMRNAMTLSGVIRRMSAGERPDRERRITSDRDV